MWNTVVSRWRCGAFALAISISGCTSLSDCKYELGQKIRTSQAWHEFDGCNEECFTSDYQSGWKAGYYDVVTGGTGCPPVIAPKKYWKPPVFFEHDPSRRNDWYCGFQDGAACAKCQPDHHYLETFLPGPACCPAPTASCVTVPCEPTQFSSEHISTDPGSEVAPVPVPESGDVPPADGTGANAAEPSAEQPAAEKPSGKDYEKDPEPATTPPVEPPATTAAEAAHKPGIEPETATIPMPATNVTMASLKESSPESLLERFVRLNKSGRSKPESMLHKLVSNASRTETPPPLLCEP